MLGVDGKVQGNSSRAQTTLVTLRDEYKYAKMTSDSMRLFGSRRERLAKYHACFREQFE